MPSRPRRGRWSFTGREVLGVAMPTTETAVRSYIVSRISRHRDPVPPLWYGMGEVQRARGGRGSEQLARGEQRETAGCQVYHGEATQTDNNQFLQLNMFVLHNDQSALHPDIDMFLYVCTGHQSALHPDIDMFLYFCTGHHPRWPCQFNRRVQYFHTHGTGSACCAPQQH